jgi:hypothetical protein
MPGRVTWIPTLTRPGASARKDPPISVAALLAAEACNVGLTPGSRAGRARANPGPAVARRSELPAGRYVLSRQRPPDRGAGLDPGRRAVGRRAGRSADGLRFVVPVRTINAAPSPRYFGLKRSVTWMNAVNDQVAGIDAVVVPGTVRDLLYILDTMLNLDAGPKPEMIATDTASYADIVFGLFRMLGYRFPRASPCPTCGTDGSPCPALPMAATGR